MLLNQEHDQLVELYKAFFSSSFCFTLSRRYLVGCHLLGMRRRSWRAPLPCPWSRRKQMSFKEMEKYNGKNELWQKLSTLKMLQRQRCSSTCRLLWMIRKRSDVHVGYYCVCWKWAFIFIEKVNVRIAELFPEARNRKGTESLIYEGKCKLLRP